MSIDSKYAWQLQRERWLEKSEFKFGYNRTVATDYQTIWDGSNLYSYLTSPSIIKVSSTNVSDTTTTITLYGLDENYDQIFESITLNGQTAVSTTKEYLRVFRGIVNTNQPLGDIYAGTGTVTSGIPANIYAKIVNDENQTLMATWTVPRNHTAYLYTCTFSTGSSIAQKFIEGRLRVRPYGMLFQTKSHITTADIAFIDFGIPLILTEKTDIELQVKSSSGTTQVSGNMVFIYIDNDC